MMKKLLNKILNVSWMVLFYILVGIILFMLGAFIGIVLFI